MASFPPPDVDAALKQPTVRTTDSRGFDFDETSPVWKAACAPLPCCAALQWPGYDTTCIDATVDGKPVVIQLWMGNCQQFLMRPNFPGGMGGEVGVYVRVPGSRPIPDSKVLPTWAGGIMNAVSKLGGHNLWWPDPDMQPEIEFTIINPIDSSILVRFGRQNTYWANRWMEPASFDRYKKDHHTPGWPTQYKMVFTINGVTRSWTPGLVSH